MKKLIITESQLQYIKNKLITEVEEDKADEAKAREQLKVFIRDVRKEFLNIITNGDVGSFVTFTFGTVDTKTGNIDKNSVTLLTLKLTNVDNNTFDFEFETSDGKKKNILAADKGDKFKILLNNNSTGFYLYKTGASVGFIPVDENGELGGAIRVNNFLSFKVTPPNVKTTTDKVFVEINSDYANKNKAFIDGMNYTPGFLGMDNFFFFPTGFLTVDKILSKFNIHLPSSNVDDGSRVTFMILDDLTIQDKVIKKDIKLTGEYDRSSRIIKFFRSGMEVRFYIPKDKRFYEGDTLSLPTTYIYGTQPEKDLTVDGDGLKQQKTTLKIVNIS